MRLESIHYITTIPAMDCCTGLYQPPFVLLRISFLGTKISPGCVVASA